MPAHLRTEQVGTVTVGAPLAAPLQAKIFRCTKCRGFSINPEGPRGYDWIPSLTGGPPAKWWGRNPTPRNELCMSGFSVRSTYSGIRPTKTRFWDSLRTSAACKFFTIRGDTCTLQIVQNMNRVFGRSYGKSGRGEIR